MKLKHLLATALLVGAPSMALAQPDPEGGGEAPTEETTGEASASASADGAVTTSASADAGMTAAGTLPWTMQIFDRPLVLPKGQIRAQLDFTIRHLSIPAVPPATGSSSATSEGLRIGGGYGVTDKLEAGARYAFSLHKFEAKGDLSLYGLYSIKAEPKLRIAATAALDFNVDSSDVTLSVGAAAYYHLAAKFGLYTPGNQLSFGFGDATTAALNLPVGFELQATPNVYAFAQTDIASIGLHPSGSSIIFADLTPLTVGAFYSPSNKLDLGVQLNAPDVAHIGDVFAVFITARIFTGGAVSGASAPPQMTAMK